MVTSALLHLIRMSRWRSKATLKVSLLWSLHLAYFFMALGLLLLGSSYFNIGITFSAGLHLITVGAIGLMILAMMSRVSLGHTGRLLTTKPIINIAFMLMVFSAMSRVLLPLFNFTQAAWLLSAFLWCLAGLIFIYTYWPILTSARLSR